MLYRGGVGPSTYSSATAASASTPAATGRKRSLKDIYEKVSDEEEEGGVYVKYIQFVHNFLQQTPAKKKKDETGDKFSETEIQMIGDHFSFYIDMGAIPLMESCRDFLKKHPSLSAKRSAQSIQDKVKSHETLV